MEKKVVVIGSGFGGLSVSALLAKEGFDVTVLEKNSETGGRARCWKVDGFTFDLGPSWYLMPEVFDNFFSLFGKKREDYYALKKLDPLYRIFFENDGKKDIPSDLAATAAIFDEFEKGAGKRLTDYIKVSRKKYTVAMKEFLYREYNNVFNFLNAKLVINSFHLGIFHNLDSHVEHFFKDHRIKKILEYAMVFLGNSPYNAPSLYSLMSHVDLSLGVYYPLTGMGAIVKGLESLNRELGVTILTGEEVTSLVCEHKQVKQVKTTKNTYSPEIVIANADYAHVETRLLNRNQQTYPESYWSKKVFAPSMLIIYLGLKEKCKNILHHNLYFTHNWDIHFNTIFKDFRWPENPCYYVCCSSRSDETVAPPGCENLFILVPVAPFLDDTDKIREEFAEKTISHLEGLLGENIKNKITVKRIFSHRDFKQDYNAFNGTALGLAHTLSQTAVFRPAMKSKKTGNLYYTGQYTHPGVGVPMTLIASQVVAKKILKETR